MDKSTVIGVVLIIIVIVATMTIQQRFFPREEPAPAQTAEPADTGPEPVVEERPAEEVEPAVTAGGTLAAVSGQQIEEQSFTIETEVFRVGFTNRGGQITSIQLKEFSNTDGSPVEMIFSQESGIDPFSIHFGDYNAPAVDALFRVERSQGSPAVTFSQTFRSQSGVPFTLKKRYLMHPSDYMIQLEVSIENSINDYPDLNYNGYAYTLGFGPQIGPEFEKLDQRNEFRRYWYYVEGKRERPRIKDGIGQVNTRFNWAAITGKYFAVIAVPAEATQYLLTYDTQKIEGLNEQSSIYFSRPEIKSSKNKDVFRFFIGPMKADILKSYNDPEKNAYGLSNMGFEKIGTGRPWLSWLVTILKFFLEMFYRLIPNYGVAIILTTILLEVLLFPLTRKSYTSMAKMQALQPKMKEIQAKYKNNQQKVQQETMAMYKREGVSPLGGCLPMVLQFPILFGFYDLLNSHFALRGAPFIPGWINDLSAPEAVFTFTPITIFRWQFGAIRALPFVMVLTTFLSSRFMQSSSTDASGRNMKMMTYMMPLMFFFIMYNMPSGLLLYWTMRNLLSTGQQWYRSYRRKKQASGGGDTGSMKRKKPRFTKEEPVGSKRVRR